MSERLLHPEQFCEAFEAWASAYSAVNREFAEHWEYIHLQIRKSCLLDRLIYQGEKLRTKKCPVHQGRWSGCDWNTPGCECRNGANVTGWLPEPEDVGYRDDGPDCTVCGKKPKKQGLWRHSADGKNGHLECFGMEP